MRLGQWLVVAIGGGAVLLTSAVACRDFGRFEAAPALVGGAGGAGGATDGGAGGMAAGPGGSGSGGSGGTPLACGLIDATADDFEGASINELQWSTNDYGGALASQSGGALTVDLSDTDSGANVTTRFGYDARDRAIRIELSEVTLITNQYFWFQMGEDSDNYAEISVDAAGEIAFAVEIEDNWFEIVGRIPFDIDEHRFWQLREATGTIYFEVSADGVSWTEHATYATSALGNFEIARVELGAYGDGLGDASGQVSVASLSGDGVSATCASATFTDDFDDGLSSDLWGYGWDDSNAFLDETNGGLQFTASSSAMGESAVIGTTRAYDLTGSSITLEMTSPDANGGFVMSLADGPEDNGLYWDVDQDTLYLGRSIDGNGSDVLTTPYDFNTMRFMRISEEQGIIYWEASADGLTFNKLGQAPVAFDITMMRVILLGYAPSSNTSDIFITVDNLNLTP